MRKAPFKRVALNASEQRLWEDTLAACSWIGPGFIHIIYTMMANSGDKEIALFTEDIDSAAATDGWQLIFNPKRYFKYDLMERVFAVFHEVMHEILNHVRIGYAFKLAGKITVAGKSVPYDHQFANFMQDFVINAILIASKMGKFNKDWLYDTDVATEADTWLDAYFRHWKDLPKIKINLQCRQPSDGKGTGDTQQGPPQKGKGKPDPKAKAKGGGKPEDLPGTGKPAPDSPMQFDVHLDPHQSTGEDPNEVPERNEAQWEIAVNTAMEIQRSQGKLPAALEHFFTELLKPKVDWTEHIRGEVMRISGSGAYDWRRLDRRLIIRGIGAPGMTGHGAGLVIIGGDTSMSIFHDKTLVARFLGEAAGVLEDVQPEETRSVWCDTEVKRVDILYDVQDLKKIAASIPGGGGTSFIPVFQYIEENGLQPDMLLYLTDGDGAFPDHAPDFPVIWGDISGDASKYPFGKVVHIPTEAADTD